MQFNWKEYYHLALYIQDKFESSFSREASLRTSVSRVYYACFCFVRNYARDKLSYTPNRSAKDHHELREHLKHSNYPTISVYLKDLYKWRNQCDYDDKIDNIDLVFEASVKKAEQIFKNLNE